MTVAESIAFVRTLLDEPKFEYYLGSSNGVSDWPSNINNIFIEALREAAAQFAREAWHRGEKEAIRTLWTEAPLTLGANQNAGMPSAYLFIESVRSNYRDASAKQWPHVYVSPDVFMRRRHRTPFEGNSGNSFNNAQKYVSRAEYTLIGNDIYATSNTASPTTNKDIVVTYIAVPTIPQNVNNAMPLAEYVHPTICEKAAEILYRKEHPGDDKPGLGTVIDLQAAIYKLMRQGVQ